MNTPLISIILPTYNVATHIERCLNSCLKQEFTDYEIIIVDDYGTDNSIEIANVYASKDSRIKIIKHEKNLGTYHARKSGTFYAEGSYILYLDPDDELAKGALLAICNQIKQDSDLDLLLFNVRYQPELKFWQNKPIVPVGCFNKDIAGNILKERKLSYGTAGKLYSKNLAVKSFDLLSIPEDTRLVYGEDILIFIGALFNSKKTIGFNEYCYVYHMNDSSITNIKDESSVVNNINQLVTVYYYLSSIKGDSVESKALDVVLNKVEVDKLFLEKSLIKTNREYLSLCFNILSVRFSPRVFVQLLISYFYFIIKSYNRN